MRPVNRLWKWELAIGSLIILAATYLLIVPPIVGVADQGDYYRLTARVGLAPPNDISWDDQFNNWLVTRWNIIPPRSIRVFSTAEYPVRAAITFHNVTTKANTLDIRWVSAVYLTMLAGLILCVLRSARTLPPASYFVIAVGLLLVCTDSEYISYFNSFYGEPAAMLGVLAFVAAGLATVTAEDPSWIHLVILVAASAFLAGSKAQNAILGMFAACWMIWLFARKPAQRVAAIVGGVGLICFSGFVLAIAPIPEANLFHAIYDRVLPNSTDPKESLSELGLKPETAVWAGKGYWDVKIESPDFFPGNATRLKLFSFYLRSPLVDLRMVRGALTLSNELEGLGSFPKESGAPRFARTQAFTGYDRLRARMGSIWLVFPLLAANIGAIFVWQNRKASLISTFGTMAASAFLIACFLDAAPQKHLFTFNLLFDVLLFADLSAAAAAGSRHISANLSHRGFMPAAAIILLLIVGVFSRVEVFPAGLWKGASFVPNLAQGKMTGQSSILSGSTTAGAGAAVDGNTNGNFYKASVTHTNSESNAWWQVDLLASATIGSIAIWNRTDCCPSRLNDYWVFISDTPFSPSETPATLQKRAGTWKSHQTLAPNPSTTIQTAGAKGRYVRIQLTGQDPLSLAEVQVFGK